MKPPSDGLRGHLRFAGALLWRGEAVHLAVFALAPPVVMLAKALLAIVLLPFALLGAGDRNVDAQHGLRHLREPGCWVMAAPCSFAAAPLLVAGARTRGSDRPAREPVVVTVRHAWLAAWIAWILVFILRRERRRRSAVAAGGGAS